MKHAFFSKDQLPFGNNPTESTGGVVQGPPAVSASDGSSGAPLIQYRPKGKKPSLSMSGLKLATLSGPRPFGASQLSGQSGHV